MAQMTRRLVRNLTFEGAVQTILDDSIALLGAEYGNVQLPIGEELAIAAQRGFSAEFLKAFWRVRRDDASACGRARRIGVPVVIMDVEKDADFAVFRQNAKSAGFRAVQSTAHDHRKWQPARDRIDTFRQRACTDTNRNADVATIRPGGR